MIWFCLNFSTIILESARHAEVELKRKNDADLSKKDAEIENAKTKMDQMADQFAQMLRETLNQMSKKVVMTNEWDSEGQKQPTNTYPDINMGLSGSG